MVACGQEDRVIITHSVYSVSNYYPHDTLTMSGYDLPHANYKDTCSESA
ncbi:hypothetical protein I2494_11580 [Budviciaceae bacterium BWR-B9]|uniref:Uncharacterized protein n=1 Tax=Limnobaculum allomyrinae TaxID=2791986 RepID=A0ABS1IRG6_9GAMM|nr:MULTISPECIES: hypothetical protein [Limnobaculum]MBK5144351.1 hypothetical protein [Limnobaculum allomyrinae]MBV7691904.1 hypothetical protein [Limnobaculum sp. M2-1]